MSTLEEIQNELVNAVGSDAVTLEGNSFVVKREALLKVAEALKNGACAMDHITCVTGVDYKEYLECVYHFASMGQKSEPVAVKVRVQYDDPKMPSLTPLFRSCEFQEREVYDMVGIEFENHPDLRRILMWEDFKAFPMRKIGRAHV